MIVLTSESGGYAPGWYALRIRLRGDARFRTPTLMPMDQGRPRLSECIGLEGTITQDGSALDAVVMLRRMAPSCAVVDGGFSNDSLDGSVVFNRLGKGAAALTMLRAIIAKSGLSDWRRAALAVARGDMRGFGDWLYDRYRRGGISAGATYREWLDRYDDLPVMLADDVRERADAPTISILMPAYNTRADHLRSCIESVLAQRYPHWELCAVDDASTDARVSDTLRSYASRDPRIRCNRRERNGHIAAATNTAFEMASGQIVALLDHDDALHPDALSELASAFIARPEWGMIFTDEDKIDDRGIRYDPYFKGDFDPDLLCAQNCVSHLSAIRREVFESLGGLRSACDGSQDWDFALRASERLGIAGMGHIPRVLYHWRAWRGSTAADGDTKPYAREAALRAISEHLQRTGQNAEAVALAEQPGNYRVIYRLPASPPRISVLIPTRDQPALLERCVRSVDATRGALVCEYVIADNGSVHPNTRALLAELAVRDDVRVFRDDSPFNYSALNNQLAAQARGDVLLFLNDDIEAISSGWLEELVAQAMRNDVGAVGAKLYYPDGRIQHAGVFLGVEGIAANAYRGLAGEASGHMNRARLTQGLSAVTAACLAMRAEVFREIGGFDERLPVAHNDVDLCLRVRSAGYRVVWTPYAELLHHESASRGAKARPEDQVRIDADERLMRERWSAWIDRDPGYNPNLETASPHAGLAFPPRRVRADAAH